MALLQKRNNSTAARHIHIPCDPADTIKGSDANNKGAGFMPQTIPRSFYVVTEVGHGIFCSNFQSTAVI